MRNFKKVLFPTFIVIVLFCVVSIIIITPSINSEALYYQDMNLRNSLTGKIDCIAVGASQCLTAFNPELMDQELGCFSYNLSGTLLSMDSRYVLLEKELAHNPVKTVMIEISHDTLLRESGQEYAIGHAVTVTRLESLSERLSYMFQYVSLDDWLNVYSRLMSSGISYYANLLKGETMQGVDYKAKGALLRESNDVSMSPSEANALYHTLTLNTNFTPENIDVLNKMTQLCKSYGARVIIVVVPVADAMLWKRESYDEFYNFLTIYCKENECELYDMNLTKNRYDLYHDDYSFFDTGHLSSFGAETFTRNLCDIIRKVDRGEDISKEFYDSYAQMKLDSPYMQYLDK